MNSNIQKKKGTLRRVLALLWSQMTGFVRWRLAATLGLITTVAILGALGPVVLKWLIDGFVSGQPTYGLSLPVLITLYVASGWLARSLGELRGLLYAGADQRMARTLSEKLFMHLMNLPLRFHLDRRTGAVTQTLANGLQGYQMVLQVMMFSILPVIAELSTVLVVLTHLDQPVLLMIFGIAVLVYAVAYIYSAVTIRVNANIASNMQIASVASMTDSILNYETVKLFAAESVVQERVGHDLRRTEQAWVRFFQRYTINGLGVAFIFTIFFAAALLYSAAAVRDGSMTVGTFVLVNAYMLLAVRPIETIGTAMQVYSQGMAYLENLLVLFEQVPESSSGALTAAAAGDMTLMSKPARLQVEHVDFGYEPDRAVLIDMTLDLPAGKTLGVVGSSGSGKSTLVRLLTRLIEPDRGRLILDGVPTSDLPHSTLRQAIAVVAQDTILFNDTIGYNIGFGKPGSAQEEIERAAKVAHLHDFIMTLPARYETIVGERGVKLSGGEKQRISIARAVLKQPRIYVFDEATSSLDSQTEREILTNLREISIHTTTLIIAHRLSTVVHADKIIVLEGGRIQEQGTHATLLQTGGRYAALWRAQSASSADARETVASARVVG